MSNRALSENQIKAPPAFVLQNTIRLALARNSAGSAGLDELVRGCQKIWEGLPAATVHDALNNLLLDGSITLTNNFRYQWRA